MSERDTAIICRDCKDTGKEHFHMVYNEFKGRVPRDDITRVYKKNPGYLLAPMIE